MLRSIKKQQVKYIEHVVVDGGSTDSTLEILKAYEGSYNLKVVSEPDSGIFDALNKGLKMASGKYVHVLQADDALLANDTLSSVHARILKNKADIYRFQVVYEFPEGLRRARLIQFLWWHRFRNIFPHQGVFMDRGFLQKMGGFRTDYAICGDYDLFYRSLNAGARVITENMPVALVGRQGVSSNMDLWRKRLEEERSVQRRNEKNIVWRLLQALFFKAYRPYKLEWLPAFHKMNDKTKK